MVARETLREYDRSDVTLGGFYGASRRKRSWDFLAILLLYIVLSIISHRLEITNWTNSLYLIGQLVMIGFFSGILLGALPLHHLFVYLIGFVGTVFLIPWQLGRIDAVSPNLGEEYYLLVSRLYPLIQDFLNNRPVEDTLLFLSGMAVLYFSMSFLAGFGLVRKGSPWIPMLVLCYSFLVTNHYDSFQGNKDLYAILLVFFILLLWGRLHYLKSRDSWRQRGIRLEYETGSSHTRATLVYAFLLILAAWNIPFIYRMFSTNSPVQFYIIQNWENLREKFSNAVVGLNYSNVSGSDIYRSGLSLGSRAATNTLPVFSVKVLTPVIGKTRYFWYGFSYNTYENGRWVNEYDTKAMSHPVDWPFGIPDWKRRHEVEFEFSIKTNLNFTYFTPNPPVYINQPGEVVLDSRYLEKFEIMAVLAEPPLRQGDIYRTISLVSTPTELDLRASGEEYPLDIIERYLTLPANFPQNIRDVALEVTAQETNAYDRAAAVTRYLRTTLEYSDRMPPAPADQDLLEWVLFDYKKGFCDYYATLEVLMLRSIGIPARFSVGYAEGSYQSEDASYLVLEKDSHAWPEVYFPSYGWIEFEPTVSQPLLIYPAGTSASNETSLDELKPGERSSEFDMEENSAALEEDNEPEAISGKQFTPSNLVMISGLLIVVAGLLYGIFRLVKKLPNHPVIYLKKFLDKRRLPVPGWLNDMVIKSQLTQVERYYLYISRMIKRLKVPVREGWTPAERFSALIYKYPILAGSGRILLNEYQKSIYSENGEDLSQAYPAYMEMRDFLTDAWLHEKFRILKL